MQRLEAGRERKCQKQAATCGAYGTESLTSREWLPGESLNGSERQRPDWFIDIKYLLLHNGSMFTIFFISWHELFSMDY